MPAASSASSNKRPAGPTKGLPVKSSSLPGCSPTNMTFTRREPSPKTVCVPFFQRSQARQSAAASLTDESVGRGGIKSHAWLSEDLYFGMYWPPDAAVERVNHESRIIKSRVRVEYCQAFWRRIQDP